MTEIRGFIPAYAGRADAPARRLADQQVRAWVGERLAAVRDRLPAGPASPVLDDVILHCEFGDQHVIKALEDERLGLDDAAAVIERADRTLLQTAADSESVDAAGLAAFVERLQALFRDRAAAIVALIPDRRSSPRR